MARKPGLAPWWRSGECQHSVCLDWDPCTVKTISVNVCWQSIWECKCTQSLSHTHTHNVLGLTDAGLAVASKHVAAQTLTAESSGLVTADGVDSANVFLTLVDIWQRDIKRWKQKNLALRNSRYSLGENLVLTKVLIHNKQPKIKYQKLNCVNKKADRWW